MAKHTYRISGESRWQSSSGNAILALTNKQGSGKKFSINSIEIYPLARLDSGTTVPRYMGFSVNRTSASGITTGDKVNLYPFKSGYSITSTLDDYVQVFTRTNDNGTKTQLSCNRLVLKSLNPAVCTANLVMNNTYNLNGIDLGSICSANSSMTGTVEPLVINTSEAIVVSVSPVVLASMIYKIELLLKIGSYRYITTFLTNYLEEGSNILAIKNTSTDTPVQILNISVSNYGGSDTPYFQVVPIGAVNPLSKYDSEKVINYIKYNSTSPSLTNIAEMYQDVPILPYNMPEYYAADSATAVVPRNFNYLATKDFIGPVYQTYFPEQKSFAGAALPDTLGTHFSQSYSNIKGLTSPIVIREGEGIGIVSAAETATAATAVNFSAFMSFNYAITFTVENAFTPYLSLTGIVNNSEVRIFLAGTTTELAGIENVENNSFSFPYDYSEGLAVDIVVHSVNYNYYRLNNISLTPTGISIPIQQIADRNYKNG